MVKTTTVSALFPKRFLTLDSTISEADGLRRRPTIVQSVDWASTTLKNKIAFSARWRSPKYDFILRVPQLDGVTYTLDVQARFSLSTTGYITFLNYPRTKICLVFTRLIVFDPLTFVH
jgi:hypothetical protein